MGLPLAVVTAIQIIGAATAVVGTISSISQGKKARRAQKAQNRRIRATNQAKAVTARRRAAREARVRQGQLAAQAEQGGFSGSSTAISGEGMTSTIQATQASNISNAQENTNAMSRGNQSIQDSSDRQQLFSSIASIGTSVFGEASKMSVTATGDGLFGSSNK
jgi:hypothetical protein